jgi:hypothetical protein
MLRHFSLLLASGGLLVGVAKAQFSYSESFQNATAAGWNFYQGNSGPGARLTAGATPNAVDPEASHSVIDAAGQGWLRLATTTSNQSNAAYFDAPIPSTNNTVTVDFKVAMWDSSGIGAGDGLTFFMRDAATPFQVGAFGGSIGYAQKTGIDGLSGGYFGVAFDVYGNYSNPTEGRSGGVGAEPNAVVLRGPGSGQTGYNYLAGTSGYNYTSSGSATAREGSDPSIAALPYNLSFDSSAVRPNQTTQYRDVEIVLDPNSQLSVKMKFGETGTWSTLFTADMSSFSRPSDLAFGFSSGTGDATQVYEVSAFSVTATGSSDTYYWDNGGNNSNKNIWRDTNGSASNWSSNANPPDKATVVFNDAYVTQNQTVDIRNEDKTVESLYLSGQYGYNVTSSSGKKLIFSSDSGTSYLTVTNSANGNANHDLSSAVLLQNDLVVNNYVQNQTLTFDGAVATGGNDITIKGPGTTIFNSTIAGGGVFDKQGAGLLDFSGTISLSELRLGGGILLLDTANIAVTTLHITGNTILDFGTGGGSVFGVTTLLIDAGVTLTVNNWTNAVDLFTAQNNPGSTALSQIVFTGYSGSTGWQSWDKQIRPVPEPSTYGAIFMGSSLLVLGGLRFRKTRRAES